MSLAPPWTELLSLFQKGKIDVIPALYKNQERNAYTLFTSPYYRGKLGIFSNDNNTSINSVTDLTDKRVGVQKSHGSIPHILNQAPGITLVEYESTVALVKKLTTKKLDAIIGNPLLFYYNTRANQITNIHLAGYVEMDKEQQSKTSIHIGVRKDWPLLHQILQKAINSVSDDEMQIIESRWIGIQSETKKVKRVLLSEAEKVYLTSHPVIRVNNEQDTPPLLILQSVSSHGATVSISSTFWLPVSAWILPMSMAIPGISLSICSNKASLIWFIPLIERPNEKPTVSFPNHTAVIKIIL